MQAFPLEIIDSNLRLSLVRSYWQQAGLDWAYHGYQRPYNWLIYTRSGSGSVVTDRCEISLQRDSMVVVPLNHLCHYRCHEPMEIGACAFTLQVAQGIDAFDLIAPPDQPLAVTDPDLFSAIIDATDDNAGKFKAMGAMYQLLSGFMADARLLHSDADDDFPRLQRVIRYIDDHLAETLQVHELAALNGHSEGHFSRWFSRMMGISAKRFIGNKRVEQATKLLLFSHLSVDAIARQCGYQDPLYFSRVFKKHIGLSPTAYRKIKSGF